MDAGAATTTSGVIELPSGLKLTVDRPAEQSAPVIVLLAAMGTPAKYYDRFVHGLTRRGHPVVRVRWRDEDRDFPLNNPNYGYADLAEVDAPAAINWTREQFGENPVVVGHSLGGQIASISAAGAGPLAGIAVIASGTNYWRGSGLRWALGVGAVSVIAPLIVRIFGYWPGGRLGFGGRQTANVIRDWARLGRTGRFEPEHAKTDLEGSLKEYDGPLLSLTIAGDVYVSRGATESLLTKLTSARIERERWKPDEHAHRGHFGWTRAENRPAEIIHEWATRVVNNR
ncbi:MAG: alpha/beta fold hydrolase [Thermoleophilaceae bacterium]|nr:alpha/beta fold hydrolase [Thermoleophilaceae bacterium]